MDLLLGLDVGTTATKAQLFDPEGNTVASASYCYGLLTPRDGWVEQDSEELWRGVVETSRAVLRQVRSGDRIVALSQSSQGGTTIPVDEEGQPTHNAISWLDQRAAELSQPLEERFNAQSFQAITGWPLHGHMPLQHIRWLRENRPDEYGATCFFLFVNDFITQRLTGQRCTNPSDAGITRLMNLTTADWDERLLDIAGIAREQLSPIHPSGHVIGVLSSAAGEATGLPEDVLVVNGAHDQYCAAVGSGVTRPGNVLLSCGTAWVLLAVPETLEVALQSGMAVSQHAVENRWGALRSLGGVGASLEWFLDNVWGATGTDNERSSRFESVNEAVARTRVGAQGLLFCPLSGGHALDISNRGGFIRLSLSHSRDDMARAVMEGIAFELRWAMEEMQDRGVSARELRMVGGAAESSVWPQIVADITGVPVSLPSHKQAACRGAAMLAGVGAGFFPDPEAGFQAFQGNEARLVARRPDNRKIYDELFHTYQRLSVLRSSDL